MITFRIIEEWINIWKCYRNSLFKKIEKEFDYSNTMYCFAEVFEI